MVMKKTVVMTATTTMTIAEAARALVRLLLPLLPLSMLAARVRAGLRIGCSRC